tara:strand:- start:1413 stop:1571 length:159 start_codon:yes stop_codon:yes gene_type:complete
MISITRFFAEKRAASWLEKFKARGCEQRLRKNGFSQREAKIIVSRLKQLADA